MVNDLTEAVQLDNAELLAWARAGSAPAAWQLFERHGDLVYSLARRLSPDERAADDMVERVFVDLLRPDAGENSCLARLLTLAELVVAGPVPAHF